MATTQITVTVDSTLKEEADRIFAAIGMTTTEAIRIFLRQAVIKQGLPFAVACDDVDHLPE